MNKLLTRKEAAQLLAVSERTLDRLRASRRLQAIRLRGCVRFEFKDVEQLVNESTDRR